MEKKTKLDQIIAEATQSFRNLNMIFCCPVPYCLERRVFFYLHAELKEHEEEHKNPQKPKKWGNKCYVCKADFVSERNRIIHNSICAARNGVPIEAFEMEEEEEQIVEVEEENPNMEEEGATGTNEMVEGDIVRENGMQDMLEEGSNRVVEVHGEEGDIGARGGFGHGLLDGGANANSDEDGLPTEAVQGHAEGGENGAKGGLGHGGANRDRDGL